MSRFQPDPELDYRAHPERYRYSPDERGVFKVYPYKEELLPHWTFRDVESARRSITALNAQFESYKEDRDFVGMDMARKYLQMGFTRAMRYAKYSGGRKYNEDGSQREAQVWADAEKREVAVLYREALAELKEDDLYQTLLARHRDSTKLEAEAK